MDFYCEICDILADHIKHWDLPVFNAKYKDNHHAFADLYHLNLWVHFYTHLQSGVCACHIGMVPFDALIPCWGYIGLVLPGVSADLYFPMAHCLYNILEWLLPTDDPTIRMYNRCAEILFDALDEKLQIPIKQQGLIFHLSLKRYWRWYI